jgi:hypothetical protein
MSIKTLLHRVKMLEQVFSQTQVHNDMPTRDVRCLSVEQRDAVTQAARIVTAIRDGSLVETDDHTHLIQKTYQLLASCRRMTV